MKSFLAAECAKTISDERSFRLGALPVAWIVVYVAEAGK